MLYFHHRALYWLISIAIFLGGTVLALPASAGSWVQQYSGPNQLNGVAFQGGATLGLAVGVHGTILRTMDAGKTWVKLPLDQSTLNAVTFANADPFIGNVALDGGQIHEAIVPSSFACAVGETGAIYTSNDGGQSWMAQASHRINTLTAVSFPDSQHGWVVGGSGTIIATTDGGVTWVAQTSNTAEQLYGVQFITTSRGWAVGANGVLLRTVNGGRTWMSAKYQLPDGTFPYWYSVSFLDASNGFVSGQGGYVIKSVDGGQTWGPAFHVANIGNDLGFFNSFLTTQEGWVVGAIPGVYHTKNGGGSWQQDSTQSGVVSGFVTDIFMGAADIGWITDGSGKIFVYDTRPPSSPGIPSVSGGSPTRNTKPTLSWSAATDNESSIASYDISFGDNGPVNVGNVLTYITPVVLAEGGQTFSVTAVDAGGNRSVTSTLHFIVDTTPPSVGTINQISATAQTPITLTATASDTNGVNSCRLFVNGSEQGPGTVSGAQVSASYTFAVAGSYTAYFNCTDAAGNATSGQSVSVNVSAASPNNPPPPPPPSPTPPPPPPPANASSTLIKLACPNAVIAADHPCKAVYFSGSDGKRHAFPNEKVYFTWYTNFDGVQIVSASAMATTPLGKNVTYRPGVKMVKFQTLSNVYAVGRGGVLRWVTNEDVARSLYGATWNKKIDDIADTFYLDYKMGANINVSSDYSVSTEMNAVLSIDAD